MVAADGRPILNAAGQDCLDPAPLTLSDNAGRRAAVEEDEEIRLLGEYELLQAGPIGGSVSISVTVANVLVAEKWLNVNKSLNNIAYRLQSRRLSYWCSHDRHNTVSTEPRDHHV